MTTTYSPPQELQQASADAVIEHAVAEFGPRLIQANSFQKEASVILDLLLKTDSQARVFTIDNGNLFPETLELWRQLEERYGVEIETYRSLDYAPDEIREAATPENAWAGAPEDCCGPYKVQALADALDGVDAWITGLRREQSHTRAEVDKIAFDEKNGLWKICPIADWTERDVWNYIAEHDLPYNKLHDAGYASIGCTNCTTPGDGREGRWAGSDKTECGLHG